MNWLRTSLAVSLLACAGCATKPVDTYYTLEFGPRSRSADPDLPVTVKVRNFDAADIYRQERIVRRTSPNTITYYDTHRWAAPLERMVTDRAIEVFRATLPVHRVIPWAEPGAADFLVDGSILIFEEDLTGDRNVATVALRVWLDENPVQADRGRYEDSVEMECRPVGPRAGDTAVALSECLEGVLEEISAALDAEIRRRAEGGPRP